MDQRPPENPVAKVEAPPPGKENLLKFETAAGLGRAIVSEVRERESARLTPLTDSGRLLPNDLDAIAPKPKGSEVSENDVKKARVGSFSVALETAAQVARTDPRQVSLREDTQSLEALKILLTNGFTEGRELTIDDTASIIKVAKAAAERWADKHPDEPEWDNSKTLAWLEHQFRSADMGLGRRLEQLNDYLSYRR